MSRAGACRKTEVPPFFPVMRLLCEVWVEFDLLSSC